ncbi:helix-turn-helix transcriptional regulator [Streptomyces sp. NBC_01485]|uniref:helix-turn-helix transcriptional regulator n=1 Tax=Streptomyces sp. NBC_01485 TaxID=2903884 RepID=UPI002E32E09A|nr:helix-turn-helix transcriptional regulator [Streptomyces sp. NBC_01485]
MYRNPGEYWEPDEYGEPGEQAASGDDAERRLLAADRLCQDSSAFLEALCVLAGEYPPATVARVAAVPAATRISGLLIGLGLVVSVGGPPGSGQIAFARESDYRLVRARLSPTRWRALHRAAAEVLDPRPALAHRARAADRPDPALAAALEEAAFGGRALEDEIGVPSRQLLLWAADLTEDRAERERRVLLAAMHDVYGEEFRNGGLWTRVDALPPSPLRYCALAGRALLEHRLGAAVDHLRAASRALAAGDTHAAPDSDAEPDVKPDAEPDAEPDADHAPSARSRGDRVLSTAAAIDTMEAAVACRTARGKAAVEAATRALDAASGDAVQIRTARRLLQVGRAYADGPHGVLRSLDEGAAAAEANATAPGRRTHIPELCDVGLLLLRGECRVLAGDLEAGARDLEGLARRHDTHPGHPDRLRALERLAIAHFLLGSWQEADSAVDGIDEAAGDTAGRALRAMLSAVRGTGAAPRRGVPASASASASASANGRVPGSAEPDRLTIATYADAVAMLAHGRHADILTAITWLTSDSAGLADAPAKFVPLWLPVYAEAAIEAAASAASEAGLAQLREHAKHSPYLMVTFHRLAGRAAELRCDPTMAKDEYEAGLLAAEGCAQVPPMHRAQLDYAYGRFLCALGQTATGLGRFQRAQDAFASLGAHAFVRNCAQDREAVTRGASPCPDAALTEREATVAGMVASGMTNRQVAEKLLIGVKAVEYHLGKIYRKLGVRTRRELASRWPSRPERRWWSG